MTDLKRDKIFARVGKSNMMKGWLDERNNGLCKVIRSTSKTLVSSFGAFEYEDFSLRRNVINLA